jgi:hypothetical protein
MAVSGITGGLGIRFGKVSLDAGILYYTGSHEGFGQEHLVFTSTVQFHIGNH